MGAPERAGVGLTAPHAPPAHPWRWLREPLLHFLLAGVALFVVYRALNPASAEPVPSNQIEVTEDDVRQLTMAWVAQGRPPPTPEQMENLVEMKVREEILFREALALGLEQERHDRQAPSGAEDGVPGRGPVRRRRTPPRRAARRGSSRTPTASRRRRARLVPPPLFLARPPRRPCARRRGAVAREAPRSNPPGSPVAARLADRFMFQDYYADRSFDSWQASSAPRSRSRCSRRSPARGRGRSSPATGGTSCGSMRMASKRIPAFEEVEPDVKREWIAERRAERQAPGVTSRSALATR